MGFGTLMSLERMKGGDFEAPFQVHEAGPVSELRVLPENPFGSQESFVARPMITGELYDENLFTMGGSVPPTGTDPVTWPWPWDWRWWGPDKEDKETEELPKGSEPKPVMPLQEQPIPLTNLLALGGMVLVAVWILRKK